MKPAEFWTLCPLTLDRLARAWCWRWRLGHGLPAEDPADKSPEEMLRFFRSLSEVTRG